MKTQKLNKRQARWALYLSRFNFMLKHVPGSKIGKVDSLSRRPDWEVGVEKDNEDKTLVKLEQLEVRKTETAEIIVDRVDLLEEVRKSKVKNDEIIKAVEEMKRVGVKMKNREKQRVSCIKREKCMCQKIIN